MILFLHHLIRDVLEEEDALLVLVVHLPDEGAAVLVPPVGPEAVLVVAEAIIPSRTDGANFRENGSQNLAGSEIFKKNRRSVLKTYWKCVFVPKTFREELSRQS